MLSPRMRRCGQRWWAGCSRSWASSRAMRRSWKRLLERAAWSRSSRRVIYRMPARVSRLDPYLCHGLARTCARPGGDTGAAGAPPSKPWPGPHGRGRADVGRHRHPRPGQKTAGGSRVGGWIDLRQGERRHAMRSASVRTSARTMPEADFRAGVKRSAAAKEFGTGGASQPGPFSAPADLLRVEARRLPTAPRSGRSDARFSALLRGNTPTAWKFFLALLLELCNTSLNIPQHPSTSP